MDVTAFARRVSHLPRTGITLALDAPQRIAALWGEVERLVGRVGRLLGRLESLTENLELLVDRLGVLLSKIEQEADDVQVIIQQIQTEVEKVAQILVEVRTVATRAEQTRAFVDEQVQRVQSLLDDFQVPLQALAPVLAQASRELHPRHLTGIASLLDQLPGLVDRLEPALTSMADLAPEMGEVVERLDVVGQVVEGLPGAKALRRRGKAKEDEDDL